MENLRAKLNTMNLHDLKLKVASYMKVQCGHCKRLLPLKFMENVGWCFGLYKGGAFEDGCSLELSN